jgi:hypothetical protein
MRAAVGYFVGLTALASLTCAALVSAAPLRTYHLKGYYKLNEQEGIWQPSDNTPWQVVSDQPWIDRMVVKWGYLPMVHDSQNYYCLIQDSPTTGTRMTDKTFVCGDPATVESIYNNNLKPKLRLYGGVH